MRKMRLSLFKKKNLDEYNAKRQKKKDEVTIKKSMIKSSSACITQSGSLVMNGKMI